MTLVIDATCKEFSLIPTPSDILLEVRSLLKQKFLKVFEVTLAVDGGAISGLLTMPELFSATSFECRTLPGVPYTFRRPQKDKRTAH